MEFRPKKPAVLPCGHSPVLEFVIGKETCVAPHRTPRLSALPHGIKAVIIERAQEVSLHPGMLNSSKLQRFIFVTARAWNSTGWHACHNRILMWLFALSRKHMKGWYCGVVGKAEA